MEKLWFSLTWRTPWDPGNACRKGHDSKLLSSPGTKRPVKQLKAVWKWMYPNGMPWINLKHRPNIENKHLQDLVEYFLFSGDVSVKKKNSSGPQGASFWDSWNHVFLSPSHQVSAKDQAVFSVCRMAFWQVSPQAQMMPRVAAWFREDSTAFDFLSLRWTPTSACYWCCWCSPNAGVWHSLRTLTSQHVQILSRLYDLSPVQNKCNPKTIPWSVVWTLSMWR